MKKEEMIELLENIDLTNYTVIIPTVCVGNVSQLATDLLISSLDVSHLGYIWHPCILTFAGTDPFESSNKLSTACELYYSKVLKLVIFQIRSAFAGHKSEFLNTLCEWLQKKNIHQVIILTGSSAHERRDKQLIGEPLRYIFCPLTKMQELKNAENRNWIELEEKDVRTEEVREYHRPYIPGGGIAARLFEKCVTMKIQCSILLEFCSDGNNVPDALKLADYLDSWLQLKEKMGIDNWITPPSWNLLFGPSPPYEIFN